MDYKIAIPSYLRHKELKNKTLNTLKNNNINPDKIYIFVANENEYNIYKNYLDENTYNKIIIGELGIKNQRIFISKYFNENDFIVSCDDDIECFYKFINKNEKLKTINNIEEEIIKNFEYCKNNNIYLWGVNGHHNSFWMSDKYKTGLYFLVGVFYGFINRHDENLYPNVEVKEDYEQCLLFYLKDKNVLKVNYLAFKTKYYAEGGCGKERFEKNKIAQEYLVNKYPDLCRAYFRKNNTPEIKFKIKNK
jgi:hypothetical protein